MFSSLTSIQKEKLSFLLYAIVCLCSLVLTIYPTSVIASRYDNYIDNTRVDETVSYYNAPCPDDSSGDGICKMMRNLHEGTRELKEVVVTKTNDGIWTIVPIFPDLPVIEKKKDKDQTKDFEFVQKWKEEYFETVLGIKNGITGDDFSGEPKKQKTKKRTKEDAERDTEVVHTFESFVPTHKGDYFDVWLGAYNNHGSIAIDPNDIWMTISLNTARYIENNAEELRSLFVQHKGKEPLTVWALKDPDKSIEWTKFMEGIIPLIKEKVNTNEDGESIVDVFMSDFSNTTPMFRSLSTAALMNGMKHYFEYLFFVFMCGIRSVYFGGEIADFEKIIDKIDSLASDYIKHEKFKAYLSNMRYIVTKFIETMKGEVDQFFWSSVMDIERQHYGSGAQYNELITGWIVHLFGEEGRVNRKKLVIPSVSVPVTYVDLELKTECNITIVGGFNGFSVQQNDVSDIYRPSVNMVLFKDLSSLKTLSEETLAKGMKKIIEAKNKK